MTKGNNPSTETKTLVATNKPMLISTIIGEYLVNKKRSDTFMKEFKDAIREDKITAGRLKGQKFELPKTFHKRDSDETIRKNVAEFAVKVDERFVRWFNKINTRLTQTREGKVPVTIETLEMGMVDFDAIARDTRKTLMANHEKGRNLGLTNRAKKSEVADEDEAEEETAPVAKNAGKKGGKKAKPAPAPEPENDDTDDSGDGDDDTLLEE